MWFKKVMPLKFLTQTSRTSSKIHFTEMCRHGTLDVRFHLHPQLSNDSPDSRYLVISAAMSAVSSVL